MEMKMAHISSQHAEDFGQVALTIWILNTFRVNNFQWQQLVKELFCSSPCPPIAQMRPNAVWKKSQNAFVIQTSYQIIACGPVRLSARSTKYKRKVLLRQPTCSCHRFQNIYRMYLMRVCRHGQLVFCTFTVWPHTVTHPSWQHLCFCVSINAMRACMCVCVCATVALCFRWCTFELMRGKHLSCCDHTTMYRVPSKIH